MAKRRSLVEALNASSALSASRDIAKRRLSRAKREALAPQAPSSALMAYSNVMSTYASRVEALVEKRLLSLLPVAGSGEGLDSAALERALGELSGEFAKLAERTARSAVATGKRVSVHGRREAGRMMQAIIPDDLRAKVSVDSFAQRNVTFVRSIGEAQVARLRKAIAEHTEGESLRKDIRDALWVSRNRSKFLARDQVHKFHAETIAVWATAAGSRRFIWHTAKDEKVRPGHGRLDGQNFAWDDPPNTGRNEGANRPGGSPGCRCRAVPVEATYQ